MDSGAPLVVLPRALAGLLKPLRALTADDIDVVADDREPAAIEVLAQDHERVREQTAIVAGIEVDLIPTQPVSDNALIEIDDDGSRLFLAGHRWALDTATNVRITGSSAEGAVIGVPVAAPGGLIAAKAHAAGFGRPARRASKHGGDLFDIYRLLEVFDAQGDIRADLRRAPADTGRLVARVIEVEMLSNPARTLRQMMPSSAQPLDLDRIVDVLEPFVEALTS